jgi:hypothetical protein
MKQKAYVPGVCNINYEEIAYRRKAGYMGLVIFGITLAVLVGLGLSWWLRLVLFIPAFLSAIGFLQAKKKFCVSYGATGMQNATDGSTTAKKVTDTTAVKKDKRRARQLNMQAAVIAAVVTAVVMLLPR